MSIASTIVDQLGGRALYMIGAKNLTDHGNGVTFKIMRNAAKATHVKITLDPSDTYTVDFLKCSMRSKDPAKWVVTLSSTSGVYFDMLRDLIASTTGLALSLGIHSPAVTGSDCRAF